MGTPAYMKNNRNRPVSAVAISVEDFAKWIYTTTRDPQKFPKQYRGDIVNQLRNSVLNLQKHVYRGLNAKCKTQHDLEKVRKIQDIIFDDLTDVQALLMIAESLRQDGIALNMIQCANLYTTIVDDFERWVKNTKRRISNIDDDIERAIKKKKDRRDGVKRDKDGFIILKRVDRPKT